MSCDRHLHAVWQRYLLPRPIHSQNTTFYLKKIKSKIVSLCIIHFAPSPTMLTDAPLAPFLPLSLSCSRLSHASTWPRSQSPGRSELL